VSDCATHISLQIMAGLYLWYVRTFRVTFLSVTHAHHVATYVHTYFVRIDPLFRASR